MTRAQFRRLRFEALALLVWIAAAVPRAIGFAWRFAVERFREGSEFEVDWIYGLRQQRETYQLDDQLTERRRGR